MRGGAIKYLGRYGVEELLLTINAVSLADSENGWLYPVTVP